MSTANIPNTIAAGEPAEAGPVEANFGYIEGFLNGDVSHTDGSKPFTGLPSAPVDAVPTAGQLVTKAQLDKQTGVLKFAEFTASLAPNYARGASWTWLGASSGSFSWPTIGPGQVFEVSAFIPVLQLSEYGGGMPTVGAALDIGLFNGESTRLTVARATVSDLRVFQPDGTPSVLVRRVYTTQSVAAGTATNINLRGRIVLGDGQFHLVGNPEYPVQILAKMG